MRAENVQVARIEFQAPAGHEEGARHPAGRQADDTFARGQRLANEAEAAESSITEPA